MRQLTFILLFVLSLFNFNACGRNNITSDTTNTNNHTSTNADDQRLQTAFENHEENIQVHGKGNVIKLLADDTTGTKHQKFILKLSSGQTILISHNIDISTKIDILSLHDTVEFYGEYVWNEKGGLVHWTHRDPNGLHIDGYLKHDGVTYN